MTEPRAMPGTNPMPTEPVKCACGRKTKLIENQVYGKGYCYVECLRDRCWEGPVRKTPKLAIHGWNKVMRAYHAAKEGGRGEK